MILGKLRLAQQLTLLGVIGSIILIFLSWNAIHNVNTVEIQHMALLHIRTAQTYEQMAAHAWKNILLRGHDSGKYEQYQQELKTNFERAQNEFQKAKGIFVKEGFDTVELDLLSQNTEKLKNNYQETLRHYIAKKGKVNLYLLDKSIQGLDQTLSEMADKLVESIDQLVDKNIAYDRREIIIVCLSGILLEILFIFLIGRQLLSNVRKLVEVNSTMFSTIEQLSQATAKQASGSSQQASSVNQTTTAVEQIKATSLQTLEKVQKLGENSERVRKEGESGTESLNQLRTGMNNIKKKVEQIAQSILGLSEQTQQIGEITRSVNALAQQSKLLSLNASIEAAKAGEAGKGFAVVASEVKDLAEKSQQATAQVQKLLSDVRSATEKSVMETEEGNKVVDEGLALAEETQRIIGVLNEVIESASLVSQQIVAAVQQETSGISQISTAMQEINQSTHETVSATAQTQQVVKGLHLAADKIMDVISSYRLTKDDRHGH